MYEKAVETILFLQETLRLEELRKRPTPRELEELSYEKLNSLLYLMEFDFYEQYEQSLFEISFIRTEEGVRMENEKDVFTLALLNRNRYYRMLFPARDELLIASVRREHGTKSVRRLLAYVNSDAPVMVASVGEAIDPELVFYRDDIHSVREYAPLLL